MLSTENNCGITFKARMDLMLYRHPVADGISGIILMNMVDTYGHANFGSKVKRYMLSIYGGIIILNEKQGVQEKVMRRRGEWAVG